MAGAGNKTSTRRAPEVRDSGTGPGQQARLVRTRLVESSITFLAFLAIFAAFGIWLRGGFLDVNALLLDVHQNVPILLLGLAALATLVPGLFDLSIAGVATLTSFLVIGLRVQQGWPFPVVLIASLAVGVVVGLVNAFVVERLRVNAFIATLGTGGVCSGLSAVYSRGTVLSPGTTGPQLPNWFLSFGTFIDKAPGWLVALTLPVAAVALFFGLDRLRPRSWSRNLWLTARLVVLGATAVLLVFVLRVSEWISGISWMSFLLLLMAFVLWVLLEYTTFGRHIRAIGSNRSAAQLAGVKVQRQVVKSFVVGGVLAALSGVVLSASQGSASPDAAATFLLPAFAAAFLSTVVLSYGRFTVAGTIIGGIFIVWVGQALIIGGLAATWIGVVNGVILVGAVALSTAMRRSSR
jgi:ribose/xylose/arabinose/galactoside ABC-type transport system permease subunit